MSVSSCIYKLRKKKGQKMSMYTTDLTEKNFHDLERIKAQPLSLSLTILFSFVFLTGFLLNSLCSNYRLTHDSTLLKASIPSETIVQKGESIDSLVNESNLKCFERSAIESWIISYNNIEGFRLHEGQRIYIPMQLSN